MGLVRFRRSWLVVAALLAVVGLQSAARVEDQPQGPIDRLVAQLGDGKYAAREAAGRALEALGEPALAALRGAAEGSQDPEIRWRAQELVRNILRALRTSKSTGLEMVAVEPGTFRMGRLWSRASREAGEFIHRVTITRPFLIGAYEVTQDEYRSVMGVSPSGFAPGGQASNKVEGLATGRFPVERVTWYDAIAFCNALSALDGFPPYYTMAEVLHDEGVIIRALVTIDGGNGYRLPTEAEWEYACRAGTTSRYHFGNSGNGTEANVKSYSAVGYGGAPEGPELGRTAEVGSFPGNPWGLFEVHGNVAEWCWDWYARDYYVASPENDPQGPDEGTHRVVRGGSWMVGDTNAASASRYWHVPGDRKNDLGFRVARTP